MKFRPMQMVAVAVVLGVGASGIALIIATVQSGGPPEQMMEGAFAAISAAIGAIAGYSVQDKPEPDASYVPSSVAFVTENDTTPDEDEPDEDVDNTWEVYDDEDSWDDDAEDWEDYEDDGEPEDDEDEEDLGNDGKPNSSGMPATQWSDDGKA